MKLQLSDKQMKRIASRLKKAAPPVHTDEEIGSGDFAQEMPGEGSGNTDSSVVMFMEDFASQDLWTKLLDDLDVAYEYDEPSVQSINITVQVNEAMADEVGDY